MIKVQYAGGKGAEIHAAEEKSSEVTTPSVSG